MSYIAKVLLTRFHGNLDSICDWRHDMKGESETLVRTCVGKNVFCFEQENPNSFDVSHSVNIIVSNRRAYSTPLSVAKHLTSRVDRDLNKTCLWTFRTGNICFPMDIREQSYHISLWRASSYLIPTAVSGACVSGVPHMPKLEQSQTWYTRASNPF